MAYDLGSDEAETVQLVHSPALGGLVALNAMHLKLDLFKAKVDAYAAVTDHYADALRYSLMYGMGAVKTHHDPIADAYPEPPPTPAGLTPEQHAAHLALHDLMSVEEFEEERCKPGFVGITAYWGANGKRKFCCEKPVIKEGQGFVDTHWYSSVKMNEMWMASIETEAAPVRRSAWEKLKAWVKSPRGARP